MVNYDRHSLEWNAAINDPEFKKTADTWINDDTLDNWRHARMRAVVIPLINSFPLSKWLTIGDGRYGNDAIWLKKSGVKTIHASDLSDTLLKISHEKGLLDSFSEQNAENLTFKNESFDFVFCKEAFHHFPRPFVALEEMMRVAKTAVILIEPRDDLIDRGPLSSLFDILRTTFKRRPAGVGFEPVGNFIYSISERELIKYQLGMHRRHIAFKGLNDSYVKNLEFTKRGSKDFKSIFVKSHFFLKLFLLNHLTKIGAIKGGNIIVAIIFKTKPTKKLMDRLILSKFDVKTLPLNPYLYSSGPNS